MMVKGKRKAGDLARVCIGLCIVCVVLFIAGVSLVAGNSSRETEKTSSLYCYITTTSNCGGGYYSSYQDNKFVKGQCVTVEARPYTGYYFGGWYIYYNGYYRFVAGTQVYSFNIEEDTVLQARFYRY